jgi:endonuclease YncB( thermonuclease family)
MCFGIFSPNKSNSKDDKTTIIDNYSDLMSETKESAHELFDTGEMVVRVIEVYDGDTFWCVCRQNGNVIKCRVRAMGYDSPEIKIKHKDISDEDQRKYVKTRAIQAKTRFTQLLNKKNNGLVKIVMHGMDNFGRILSDIYNINAIDEISINEIMIKENHGYRYDGKTKVNQYEYFVTHPVLGRMEDLASIELRSDIDEEKHFDF